ncbi:hypothetical protein HanRHA438_Chr11g0519551 [Helianthus annuus]|nr:hypothetical protein HanRHA438_Chr11g0519551 [Helianthus annuus]
MAGHVAVHPPSPYLPFLWERLGVLRWQPSPTETPPLSFNLRCLQEIFPDLLDVDS